MTRAYRPQQLARLTGVAALVCITLASGSRIVAQVAIDGGGERNYDARLNYNAAMQAVSVELPRARAALLQARMPDAAATFDSTTGVTRTLFNQTGYLSEPSALEAQDIALDFVRTNPDLLGLDASVLADLELTDVSVNRATGSTHVYWRQRHRSLPVYNAQLQVNINRQGRIISINNAFHPSPAAAANDVEPAIDAAAAVAGAARHLGVAAVPVAAAVPAAGPARATRLEAPALSRQPIEATLMWLPVNRDELKLVWRFQVETLDAEHWYDMTVDASSGEVWTRFDWVASDQYKVYPQPVESPNHTAPAPPADGRVTIANPANGTASPFAWHDTNGVAGAEFTIMRGNNVHAYDDIDNNNTPPVTEPDCGAGLDCSFAADLTADPTTYTSAAIANLFYWNNVIHDVQYQYGFTELAGNFQVNNYGRGGLGNDDVRAEAQDGEGLNNANFGTPPDGQRPRMQMYLWDRTSPRRDGDFDNGIIVHEYGHGISNRLVGGPSNVSCLTNRQQPGEGLSDWWALVYTVRAADTGPMGRGVGTYALGQATTGPGIRGQRYSTDPAVNTWTYQSINGMTIPHGVGSVWAQAAWEMYWALVDAHGFSADLYDGNGTAGNQRAMLYVNEGLMNTICLPSFVDVRNGIIAAAIDNHGGEDVCRIWQAFAAFGLGEDAVDGGPDSTSPTNGFSVPAACQVGAPAISINDNSTAEGQSGTTALALTVSLSTTSASTVTVRYATADGTATSDQAVNPSTIRIPSSGTAALTYPSMIAVGPGLGLITNLTVTLTGFSHTWPSDVDVLLVGPGGQTCVLMSDVGSSIDVINRTFTFDDTGPSMPTGAVLTSGTFRPTNAGTGDPFPAPAPGGTHGATLSGFNGTSPAGTWRLYVVDDTGLDGGSISAGWSLAITATGGDYVRASGTLTFPPGTTSQPLPITINGDTVSEPLETFVVNLSNAINSTIADGQGVATILNDESIFTDDPIVSGTVVKAVHLTELRTAVNDARARHGLGPYPFAEAIVATATLIRASHIVELRTALDQAYVAAGMTPPSYDPSVAAGMLVRAVHINELRAAVLAVP